MSWIPDRDASGRPIYASVTEADIGDFKAATHSFQTNAQGYGSEKFLIPGTFQILNADPLKLAIGRYIFSGEGWFDGIAHKDDLIKVTIVDGDNNLGLGVDAPLGFFYDEDVASANQGHRINKKRGWIELGKLAGYGELPAGMYLHVEVWTGDGRQDYFSCNYHWLKPKALA